MQSDGKLVIGGTFTFYNGTKKNRIVRLNNEGNSIITGAVSSAAYCAGSSVSVPFTANGVYNSGNIFTAQLSNASGSFSAPVSIGTLTATSSGIIAANIPVSTVTGSGYRIRVAASGPAIVGIDNGSPLSVTSLPIITITASDTNVCPGTPVTLTASGADTYIWQPGSLTGSSVTVSPTSEITYSVIGMTNGCSSPPSAGFTVTVNDTQKPVITCPSAQTLNLNATCAATLPDYSSLAIVSDNCSQANAITIAQSPAIGSAITGVGVTVVTLTATDAAGNSQSCTFNVERKDIMPPSITCVAPITVNNDANKCGAVVTYNTPNNITFSQQFTGGLTSTHCNEWKSFRAQLVASLSYTKLTIKGSFDPVGVSLTNPSLVAQVANALRTGAAVAVTEGGRTWRVGACTTEDGVTPAIELSASATICNCTNGYSVRPCIQANSINPNWGGVGTQSCSPPSQVMTVVFELGSGGAGLTATDNCSGSVTITQTAGLPSGSQFPVGVTTNTFVATDVSGNTSTCSFNVTVVDNQKPVIATNGNQTVTAAAGTCGAAVSVSATATDNCSVGAPLGVRNDGKALSDVYPVGTTTIAWSVTDVNTNTAVSVSQTVTVTDKQSPVLAGVPSNVTVECTALPAVAAVSAIDNCTFSGIVTYSEVRTNGNCPSNYLLTRTWSATDAAGNTATATQVITVRDTQAPNLTVPSNITVNSESGICGAAVTYAGSAIDNCGAVSLSYSKASGSVFPIGITTVTITATDACGNASSGTFTITVEDAQKPLVSAPADQFFCFAGTGYTFAPLQATDNCAIAAISYVITGATTRSGSGSNASGAFQPGTSLVTWTVTDLHGNSQTAVTKVVVNPEILIAIPAAQVLPQGVLPNTVYIGYAPAGTLSIQSNVAGGTAPYTYAWQTSSHALVVTTSNASEPYKVQLQGTAAGDYAVTVSVTDSNGCSRSFTQTITVVDVRCGSNNDKVLICRTDAATTPGNGKKPPKDKVKDNCVSPNVVANLLSNGASLGACPLAPVTVREGAEKEGVPKVLASLSAYPNPSKGAFQLRFKNFKPGTIRLSIVDAQGRQVAVRNVSVAYTLEDVNFDLSNLAQGIYLVKAEGQGAHAEVRIVVGR
jgi:hypothetical protein